MSARYRKRSARPVPPNLVGSSEKLVLELETLDREAQVYVDLIPAYLLDRVEKPTREEMEDVMVALSRALRFMEREVAPFLSEVRPDLFSLAHTPIGQTEPSYKEEEAYFVESFSAEISEAYEGDLDLQAALLSQHLWQIFSALKGLYSLALSSKQLEKKVWEASSIWMSLGKSGVGTLHFVRAKDRNEDVSVIRAETRNRVSQKL